MGIPYYYLKLCVRLKRICVELGEAKHLFLVEEKYDNLTKNNALVCWYHDKYWPAKVDFRRPRKVDSRES
jgi:hypothetical protein